MRWLKWLLRECGPPLVFFVLVVSVWAIAVRVFEIIPYLLPGPMAVLESAAAPENRRELVAATWMTAKASLLGLLASLVVGTLVAIVFSSSSVIRRGGYPYAIFLQTVPIVAIAPLIIIWFGRGVQSVVIVSFILSVFPIITNGTTGLMSADRNLEELFRLHNAKWWQKLLKLRLPSAIPFLLAGLRIGAGAAVIGAIVGEFFVGSGVDDFGLGYLIRLKNDRARTDELFAAVLMSTLLGVLIFAGVSGLSRLIERRWFCDDAS